MKSIKMLLENTGSENKGLISEHGLSLIISIDEKNYLFDCSKGGNFIKNAMQMNVDLSKLDGVICSHSHYDHSAGFKELANTFNVKRLITGVGFFKEKYAMNELKATYLGSGFDSNFLEEKKINHIVCDEIIELEKDFYVVGNFKRLYEFEQIQDRFVKKEEGILIKDYFEDEISVVIKTDKGLIVVMGCSHPGILNMLETIQKRFDMNIYAVYGGTHLVEADENRCRMTLNHMKQIGVKILGLCHCSGEQIIAMAREEEEFECCRLSTGDEVIL